MAKLHIIGNGFDRFHDLPTSYWHFHEWLIKNGHNGFVESLEWFFSERLQNDQNLLWCDFEKALGKCDMEESYEMCTKSSEELKGELPRYLTEINDTITVNFVNPLRHDMPKLFIQWIQSVNEEISGRQPITDVNPMLRDFEKEGLFLTFNYTDTLEQIYGIPSENICHIHNRVAQDETPIVGHNTQFKMDEPIEMTLGERQEKKTMEDTLNGLKKQHSKNIRYNSYFFKRINQDIDTIVVYGHSVGDIDMPYFRYIKNHVNSNATWRISYLTEQDYENIKTIHKKLKLKREQVIPFFMKNCDKEIPDFKGEIEERISNCLDKLNVLCDRFDKGDNDALYSACTILRWLLSDTKDTTSLLTQIEQKKTKKFIDSSIKNRTGFSYWEIGDGVSGINLQSSPAVYAGMLRKKLSKFNDKVLQCDIEPLFDKSAKESKKINFDEWYHQEIYANAKRSCSISRKDIIESLPENEIGVRKNGQYDIFKDSAMLGFYINGNPVRFAQNPALVSLRQIAWEVLTSMKKNSMKSNNIIIQQMNIM